MKNITMNYGRKFDQQKRRSEELISDKDFNSNNNDDEMVQAFLVLTEGVKAPCRPSVQSNVHSTWVSEKTCGKTEIKWRSTLRSQKS